MSKKRDGGEFVPEPKVEAKDGHAPELSNARTWNGLPVYACSFVPCAFDTLDPAVLEVHEKSHVEQKPNPARAVILTDRFGNEIKENKEN